MPQTIDIPDVGRVEFPDSMSDVDITRAIQKDIIPRQQKRQRLVAEQKEVSAEPDPSVTSLFIDKLAEAHRFATQAQIDNAKAQAEFVRSGEDMATISPKVFAPGLAPLTSIFGEQRVAGWAEGAANIASHATSPLTLGTAAAATVAPEIVGPAVTLLAGKDAIDKRREALEATSEGDTQKAARLNTEAVGSLAMAAGGSLGLAKADALLPSTVEAVSGMEKGQGSPPIQAPERLLAAPSIKLHEFSESTLGIRPEPKALPAPGESVSRQYVGRVTQQGGVPADVGSRDQTILLPSSELAPRTEGYRVAVPPFEERPTPSAAVTDPTAVENLRQLVKISAQKESESSAQPFKEPTVSTDLHQLERVMQRNSISTIETWADNVIKEKLSGSSANPYLDPEFLSAALVKGTVLLKRGIEDFADWSKPMVQQFGRDITPHLEQLYKSAKEAAGRASVAPNELKTDPPIISGTPLSTPSSEPARRAFETATTPPSSFSDKVRQLWRSAANEAVPNMTSSSHELGESAVHVVSSRQVAGQIGEIFAEKVLRGLKIDPKEFGAFIVEDNLRWAENNWRDLAEKAKDPEDKADFIKAADAVGTIIGAKDSPFKTAADWRKFWDRPDVQEASSRYSAMWKEQKDPLFRQANDLAPETPLASRGLLSGMRVNMKAIMEGDKPPTAIAVRDSAAGMERIGDSGEAPSGGAARGEVIRQMATVRKYDPFRKRFSGLAPAYEADLVELMRNGFRREMPVAAQHEFIRRMIDSGDAMPSSRNYEPDLMLKGEATKGMLLELNPWANNGQRFLQVRKSLVDEFESVTGLRGDKAIHPAIEFVNQQLTRASVMGLAEGTTHASNLLSRLFTGPGPTSNPLLNALIKSIGRVDLVYSLPRVFYRGMTASREEMIKLTEMGAAKEPYSKISPTDSALKQSLKKISPSYWLLDPIDRGVRLYSADLYDGYERAGWIADASETGKREFINQVGNYNKALQPIWLRAIRTNLNPFATAVHTFAVGGLRSMAMSPGIGDLTPAQRVAFAADIMGGWLGFVTIVAGLNYLLSKPDASSKDKVFGPPGTTLGNIGWIGDDGNTHQFPAGMVSGFARGPRLTGLLAAEEAVRRGEGASEAITQGAQAVTQSGLNYLAGPLVRFGTITATGYAPQWPPHRESPVQPPSDEFSLLKNQFAANVATALKEASPPIDSAISFGQGLWKGNDWGTLIDEAGKKQLQRYWPKTASSVASKQDEDFADIVRKSRLNDFVDDITKQAKKLPEDKRRDFLEDQIDKVPDDLRKSTRRKLKEKGAFKND